MVCATDAIMPAIAIPFYALLRWSKWIIKQDAMFAIPSGGVPPIVCICYSAAIAVDVSITFLNHVTMSWCNFSTLNLAVELIVFCRLTTALILRAVTSVPAPPAQVSLVAC